MPKLQEHLRTDPPSPEKVGVEYCPWQNMARTVVWLPRRLVVTEVAVTSPSAYHPRPQVQAEPWVGVALPGEEAREWTQVNSGTEAGCWRDSLA